MTPSLPLSQHTVAPHWRHAFGGVWRLTFRRYLAPMNLLLAVGLMAGLALLSLTSIRHGHTSAAGFVDWSVQAYLGFALPIAAFLISAGLVRDDMTASTVDYVLTRPVARPQYLFFRYLANTACLQLASLGGLAVLLMVGIHRGVPDLGAIMAVFFVAQVLAIAAFGAMGFAFGALTGRYLVMGIAYAAIVEAGLGHIPTQLSRLSMVHHLRTFAGSASGLTGESIAVATLCLLVFTVLMLTIAAALFTLRELSGGQARDV